MTHTLWLIVLSMGMISLVNLLHKEFLVVKIISFPRYWRGMHLTRMRNKDSRAIQGRFQILAQISPIIAQVAFPASSPFLSKIDWHGCSPNVSILSIQSCRDTTICDIASCRRGWLIVARSIFVDNTWLEQHDWNNLLWLFDWSDCSITSVGELQSDIRFKENSRGFGAWQSFRWAIQCIVCSIVTIYEDFPTCMLWLVYLGITSLLMQLNDITIKIIEWRDWGAYTSFIKMIALSEK